MLIVVGLALTAVLIIVIPLGTIQRDHDWALIVIGAAVSLAIGGLYLYFWIVVLELFIRLAGPIGPVSPPWYSAQPQPMQIIYGPQPGGMIYGPPPGPGGPQAMAHQQYFMGPQPTQTAHYGTERPF